MSECGIDPNALIERLEKVRLAARPGMKASRHLFRGEPSYVLHDPVRFSSHRLGVRDYRILAGLDDTHTLAENFERMVAAGDVERSEQSEFYEFIVKLQMMGLLNLPSTNANALYERSRKQEIAQKGTIVSKLFYYKIPLCNPDAMLDRTIRFMRFAFSRTFFVMWLIGGFASVGILAARFDEFFAPLGRILATENLLVLWVTLILLKVWHELGHGWACKNFGGSVPDMGALFFALTPCAYVDASSTWTFTRTRDRIIVSLGGMYFESIAAILATFVWAFSSDPFIRSCAQQVLVLSTITTVLFNANPLMRYDGYYVLTDLLEIPNLRAQAQATVKAWAKKIFLGLRVARPGNTRTMEAILLSYGLCATIYKSLIVVGLSMAIAYRLPVVGFLVGVYYVGSLIIGLTRSLYRYLWQNEETAPVRTRAKFVGTLAFVSIPLMCWFMPACTSLRVQGVVGAENEQWVRSEVGGYLDSSHIQPGATVRTGDPLYTFVSNEALDAWHEAQAEIQLARQEWLNYRGRDHIAAAQALETMRSQEQQARLARDRVEALRPKASIDGRVASCVSRHRPGDYFDAGEPLAVIVAGPRVVRVLMSTEQLTRTLPDLGKHVRCRLRAARATGVLGAVVRVAPAGESAIAYDALTQLGEGAIVVDPNTHEANSNYFEVTIELEEDCPPDLIIGSTAIVRFRPRYESIASYLFRKFKIFYAELSMS